jgi:nucleotide-binding universal stress UspA family protein
MTWRNILVPHDFSASANHAAAIARDEAKLRGAAVVVVHVLDLPRELDADTIVTNPETNLPVNAREYATTTATAHLEALAQRLRKDGVTVTTRLRVGSPVDEILAAATDLHADVIIMGTHGHGGIRDFIAGNVAERVIRGAHVPVLVVRAPNA